VSTIKSSAENLTLNADGANNDVIIQSNGSTVVTVDGATSNVGIGTTSISFPSGTGLEVYDASVPRIKLANSTTGNASTDGFDIHVDGSDVKLWQRENANMIFATNGAERVRVQAAGGISFNGDTAAANALNDYEQGTWTPQVKIDGSTTGITHDAQGGAYTKIGNTVILTAVLAISSKGSETGSVTFANFPFTIENWTATSSLDGGSASFGYYSGTSGISNMGAAGQGGTTTAQVYRQASDQSQLNDVLTNSQILDGFSTRWTLIFQTTS
jgi:hypothetical protein